MLPIVTASIQQFEWNKTPCGAQKVETHRQAVIKAEGFLRLYFAPNVCYKDRVI